jgi:hypothetical protein
MVQPSTNNPLSNMTQSVDQTSTTDVALRRHNDPPGLWVAVLTSSVALHLLLFWLMRYSNAFSLWFPRDSEAIIPIEVIEISPTASQNKPVKPQLKAKTVSPPSANQQSSTVTARNENSSGINFGAIRKQRKRNTFVSKPNTQVVPKQSVPTFTPTPTPTSSGNLPRKRLREEISLGKPTPLSKFTPVEPRQPIGEDSQTPIRRTPRQPISEDSQTPSRRTPRQPISEDSQIPSRRTPRQPIGEDSQTPIRRTPRQSIGEDSQTPSRRTPRQPIGEDSETPTTRKTPQPSTAGGIIASWGFLSREEQRSLMRSPLPEGLILPEYQGIEKKPIDSIDLPEGEFLASLVIDKNGIVQPEITVYQAIPPGQESKYQQFANSIFQGKKFQPARSKTNNTPVPELINRFVRVKIQRR